MRHLGAVGLSFLVGLATSVSATSPDDSPPSISAEPHNTYRDTFLPKIYDYMSLIQLMKNETRIEQGFNESSFYLPTWPDLQELKIVQNGTAIRVPPMFWQSALQLDFYPSPEAVKFLFEGIPLTPKTAAFHELSPYLVDVLGMRFKNGTGDTSDEVTPSMNAILNTQFAWTFNAFLDVPLGGCPCSERNREDASAAPLTGYRSSHPGWDCTPRDLGTGMKFGPKANAQDVWLTMFDAVVDVLANGTIVSRLEKMALPNRHAERDRELMRIAGLPLSASSSVLGALIKVQYSLYQELTVMHNDCPMPIVECGKYSADPCDRYPPRK